MKKYIITIGLLLGYWSTQAQIGFGTPTPAASAIVDMTSINKGFLPPRLTTDQRDAIMDPADGLTVYNISKNCLEWYNGTTWYNGCGDNGLGVVTSYICNTGMTGGMTAGIPVSGVTQTITAIVGTVGAYDIKATSNGVTFSASGNFVSAGPHNIILYAAGTPITAGTHSFTLDTSPNTCSFDRDVTTGTGSASQYVCNTATSGTMTAGVSVSGVTQTITATVTALGNYTISTAPVNGVTFSGSGTFTELGPQTVVLQASGIPTAAGDHNFTLSTTPSCSFSRMTVSAVTGSAICDGSVPTEVKEIVSATGKIWMDRNLGASRAAISSTDFNAYGCLYQYGRGNDGHAGINWTSGSAGTSVNRSTSVQSATDTPTHNLFIRGTSDWRAGGSGNRLWQGSTGVNNPCPMGYRVPTQAEFQAEMTFYDLKNAASAFANGPSGGFKFTQVGHHNMGQSTGVISGVGGSGYYWTSTASGAFSANVEIVPNGMAIPVNNRAHGFAVRCIKD